MLTEDELRRRLAEISPRSVHPNPMELIAPTARHYRARRRAGQFAAVTAVVAAVATGALLPGWLAGGRSPGSVTPVTSSSRAASPSTSVSPSTSGSPTSSPTPTHGGATAQAALTGFYQALSRGDEASAQRYAAPGYLTMSESALGLTSRNLGPISHLTFAADPTHPAGPQPVTTANVAQYIGWQPPGAWDQIEWIDVSWTTASGAPGGFGDVVGHNPQYDTWFLLAEATGS